MNREIKFRFWEKGRMYYDVGVMDTIPIDVAFKTYDTPNYEVEKFHNAILMQFTGIKDKNGREIYEGDLIEVVIGKIKSVKEVKWLGAGFNISPPNEQFSYEVVGNIFENSNLL